MSDLVIAQQIGFPVFQNKVYATQADAKLAVRGDVELVQCPTTGLVYNRKFNSELLDYDSEYQNEQACSQAFKRHLEDVLEIVLRNFNTKSTGVEIGCGKGFFLEMMRNAGVRVRGYDPAYEGNSAYIVKAYFGKDTMESSPDFIVLRHVLEHIPSPWIFLEQLALQCGDETKIYIEVPCFDWIVQHKAFYDIFYEHVNYFTLEVLKEQFLSPIESGLIFGGQYQYVVAKLSDFQKLSSYPGKRFNALNMDEHLSSILENRAKKKGKVYIWGAGAKGITFSNILLRKNIGVEGLIDINPAKQNKYVGGSGFSIKSPQAALDRQEVVDIFVMNSNYRNEIEKMTEGLHVNLIMVD